MIDFAQNALTPENRYFIVLDGLDECEEGQMMEVAEIFHDLLASSSLPFKIFLSTRPNVSGRLFKKFSTKQRISLETKDIRPEVGADIEKYISVTLEDWLSGEEPELQVGDPTVIPEIRDRLVDGSDCMYVNSYAIRRD